MSQRDARWSIDSPVGYTHRLLHRISSFRDKS